MQCERKIQKEHRSRSERVIQKENTDRGTKHRFATDHGTDLIQNEHR